MPQKCRNNPKTHDKDMKKLVLVDFKGIFYKTMKKVLEYKVKFVEKDLVSSHSLEGNSKMPKFASSSKYI